MGTNGPERGLKASRINDQLDTLTTLLPYDVDTAIPERCLDWLKSYHLTYKDIIDNGICWSESRTLLIFPYDNCWQGRYFGTDPAHPKWWSKGNLDDMLWGKRLEFAATSGVVLCEDIISVLRVGKHTPSLCLFGSTISRGKLGRILSHVSRKIIWWLDYDKKEDANQQAIYLQGLGYDARCIVTPQDPKELTDQEIISIIGNLK